MKRVQGNNLFTVKSVNSGKPELRPEIKEQVERILEDLDEGETYWFDEQAGRAKKET